MVGIFDTTLPFAIPGAASWSLATLRHQQNFTGSILPFASTSYFTSTLAGEVRENCDLLRVGRDK
jgi:hypothetical protein